LTLNYIHFVNKAEVVKAVVEVEEEEVGVATGVVTGVATDLTIITAIFNL
jgi:hypothetical protein